MISTPMQAKRFSFTVYSEGTFMNGSRKKSISKKGQTASDLWMKNALVRGIHFIIPISQIMELRHRGI